MSVWDAGLEWLEDFLRGTIRTNQWQIPQLQASSGLFNTVTQKFEAQRTANVLKPFVLNLPANGTAVWTPASGKRFRVMGWCIQSNGATGFFRDGVGGTNVYAEQNGIVTVTFQGNGYLSSAVDNRLVTFGCAADQLSGVVWGTEE